MRGGNVVVRSGVAPRRASGAMLSPVFRSTRGWLPDPGKKPLGLARNPSPPSRPRAA